MKADLSRDTFRKQKHYSSVRMQQGRVQVDADWNEALDILGHRRDTETLDVIGPCGAPLASAGFRGVAAVADLSAEEQAREENQDPVPLAGSGDFYISAGRLYVDGTLCENEHIVPYSAQPHLPAPPLVDSAGIYIAYLDVWQYHVTALEDDEIREKALNGVDTATRTQTVWQVRWLRAGDIGDAISCLTPSTAYDSATAAATGTLAARAQPGGGSSDPCIVPSSAGYRRLENQLYRVEVHDDGNRGSATFKWSRENGTVVARWESQNADQITVSSTGRDRNLGFNSGDWVELIDDERELLQQPGTLVRLLSVSDNVLTLETDTATGSIDMADFHTHPKVRRWDSAGAIQPGNGDWFELEDGVQVRLGSGSFRNGDYWLIPARTNTGEVEWPRDEASGDPALRPPAGISHDYCRLAVMTHDGSGWTKIEDCRPLFPALTQLKQLFYVSGDGQEALPGSELDEPLQVGVSNGRQPVAGARVRFTRIGDDGSLLPGTGVEESGSASERIVITGDDGIAECRWRLGAPSTPRSQQVEAVLLDVIDTPQHLPIRFSASLSLAAHVYYDGDHCAPLADADTVQAAIDTLARQATISAWQGDGQEAPPGTPLSHPLQVVISNACGPIANAEVAFQPDANGRVAGTPAELAGATPGASLAVNTDTNGLAGVYWQLDPDADPGCQRLRAELLDAGDLAIRHPSRFYFTGCLARQQTCLTFLDELRSNGISRPSPRGPLGLAVSEDPANSSGIVYTAGIAYVAGCRFEIAEGSLPVPALSLPERLIVDDKGQVMFLREGSEPADWAVLADIYLALDGSRITRILDRRVDLTHLDRQLDDLEAEAARHPADRRAAVPVLAQSLPHLRYRDGRNARIAVSSNASRFITSLAFDGHHVWAAVWGSDLAYRIPRDRPTGEALETITIGGDPAFDVCYDGAAHVWFTTASNGTVVSVNTQTGRRNVYEIGGYPLFALATGPDQVWITNYALNTINIIDPGRGEILATINVIDPVSGAPLKPVTCAFDGKYVWLGCIDTSGRSRLMRATSQTMDINFEDTKAGINGTDVINSLCFDGARLWVQQPSQILLHDVAIDDGSLDETITPNDPRWPGRPSNYYKGVCDGRRVWLAGSTEDGYALSSHEARFANIQGRVPIINDARLTAMTFDGIHMWFAGHSNEGPQLYRYLAAGD